MEPENHRGVPLLPLVGTGAQAQPAERADAARNRRKVLAAAAELFAERAVESVSMDDVAARAGVGKGTLYRRFGDRGGLAAALLDEREHDLQERVLTGPAPLGPGCPPVQRLTAFVEAYLDYALPILDVVLISQTSTVGARHHTGSHRFWVTHCRILLESAGAPDPQMRAEALLAALSAEQLRHWRNTTPPEDLYTPLRRLAEALAVPLTEECTVGLTDRR